MCDSCAVDCVCGCPLQFRLGMFDPPSMQPYLNISIAEVNSPAHQQLALDAARQGMVLLKNDDSTLPLSQSKVKTLAVIGPNGECVASQACWDVFD